MRASEKGTYSVTLLSLNLGRCSGGVGSCSLPVWYSNISQGRWAGPFWTKKDSQGSLAPAFQTWFFQVGYGNLVEFSLRHCPIEGLLCTWPSATCCGRQKRQA